MLYISISIVTVILLLKAVGLALCIKNHQKASVCLFSAAYITALAVAALRRHFLPAADAESERYYEEIYIGENTENRREKNRLLAAEAFILVLLISAAAYLYVNMSGFFESPYIEELNRPGKGSRSYELNAEYENRSYRLKMNLSAAYPDEAEMNERFEKIKAELGKYILGENESPDEVKSDLKLDYADSEPELEIFWKSSDSEIIDINGKVYTDRLDRSKKVRLTADITYYELSDEMFFDLTVCPADEEARTLAALRKNLEELSEEEKHKKSVDLPESFEGEDIRFSIYKENNSVPLMLLGIFAAFMVLPFVSQKKRQKRRERNTQLIVDYPELTAKLALLLESGMTIRTSFERIAADYEKRKQKQGGRKAEKKRRYVYEEMLKTRNEMALGVSETECYEHFGRRCGNMYYIRLASLLIQNVKKGNESLLVSLHQEISEARKERQAEIRKKGEETGMKLLVPMAGMFVLVLAVILIPAFMAM